MKPYIDKDKAEGSWTIHILQLSPMEKGIKPEEYGEESASLGMTNYKVTYTTEKFEVLEGNITLYGGEYTTDENGKAIEDIVTNTTKITTYAGLTVPEVTIKNLTSLTDAGYKADRWYTLVLPFDVTVREISSLFGYAIVNVPKEGNNNPNDIVYGLTMGTVPANTVMAFKIDESVNDEEAEGRHNPEWTFEGKTIVAIPASDGWFTDAQENQAIGTYEPTVIKGENQFWMIPGKGMFQRASVQNMSIVPFNGYFQFAATPANARIILEEADGSTTAINAITGETIHNAAEGWYTIDGVKLNTQPTQKGIYINNGMKVVIK